MNKSLVAVVILGLSCTYDPPTRSAEWYENPEPYSDDSARHPKGAIFQKYLDDAVGDGLPGAVLLIRTPEDGTWVGASGHADLANDVPWGPSMIARVGSVSKTFTAAVLLRLLEQHSIPLDTPAKDWLPAKLVSKIANADVATIEQLLHNTSGIHDYLSSQPLLFAALGSYDFPYHTKEQLLEYAYDEPAKYRPGEGWNYSNTNFLLLETIAERISGRKSQEVFESLVVSELGLRSTFYAPSDSLPKGLVRGYADIFADERLIDVTDTNQERFHFDGGVISNVYDLADFLDAMLFSPFLSDAARTRLLQTVPVDDPDYPGVNHYGLGIILEQHPEFGPIYGHAGTTTGNTAHVYHVERSGVTFAALVNGSQKVLSTRSSRWFSPLRDDGILRLILEE